MDAPRTAHGMTTTAAVPKAATAIADLLPRSTTTYRTSSVVTVFADWPTAVERPSDDNLDDRGILEPPA